MASPFVIGTERQEVALDQRHVVCPRHMEPFRAEWPLGWPTFAMSVSQAALDSPALQGGLSNPRFWTMSDLWWEDLPRRAGPAQVRQLLEDRPACEWLEAETLMRAYLASGIGKVGLCRVCGIVRAGTRYGVRTGQTVNVLAQACFVCVVAGRVGR